MLRLAIAALITTDLCGVAFAQASGSEELLERTLAVVGGQPITQSDVDLAVRLGLVPTASGSDAQTPIARLVDRALMLSEVARFAPPEPDTAIVTARVAAVRQHVGSTAAFEAVLARAGVSAGYVEAWVRDDLRIGAYLDQRFASAGAPTESEVDGYYQAHIDEFLRAGTSQDDGLRQSRERLVVERRRALIADWLADVRRRTGVVEFPGG